MDIHRVYRALLRGFRRRRMRRFVATFRPHAETTILDVGGAAWNWELAGLRSQITLLNVAPPDDPAALPAHYEVVTGSGTDLPYPDRSFDVAFSNSVIEHLGSYEAQWAFAAQMRRVARHVWVQTPARGFFFEPHLLAPFVHWLPRGLQRPLLRWATPWGWLAKPSSEQVDRFLRETRLLTRRELRALFPDCEIRSERFLGLTKAYVAVRDGD